MVLVVMVDKKSVQSLRHFEKVDLLNDMQGLYEYVKPSWQERPRPKVDEEAVKAFGNSVPPRPLNPSKDQHHHYAVTAEIEGHNVPRFAEESVCVIPMFKNVFVFCSIDRTLKMYIGGAQKRPDAPYARSVVSPTGAVVGQVGEGNRKDIREAVEAAHKAAPGYILIVFAA